MITTTLKKIQRHKPYASSWKALLRGLSKKRVDDKPLPYSRIVEICGLSMALWAMRAEPGYRPVWVRFACDCVRHVLHLHDEPRVAEAFATVERYAMHRATDNELAAARRAMAIESHAVARAVERAANAAKEKNETEAAKVAAIAIDDAALAAGGARGGYGAEREWQRARFLEIVGGKP